VELKGKTALSELDFEYIGALDPPSLVRYQLATLFCCSLFVCIMQDFKQVLWSLDEHVATGFAQYTPCRAMPTTLPVCGFSIWGFFFTLLTKPWYVGW
jgi:hypothetical protein